MRVSKEQITDVETWLVERLERLVYSRMNGEFLRSSKPGIVTEPVRHNIPARPFVQADQVSYSLTDQLPIFTRLGSEIGATHHYDARRNIFARRWPFGMEFSRRYAVTPIGAAAPTEWIATTVTDRHHRIVGYNVRNDRGENGLDSEMARDYRVQGEDGISHAGRLLVDFARDVFGVDLMEDLVVDSLPLLLESGN